MNNQGMWLNLQQDKSCLFSKTLPTGSWFSQPPIKWVLKAHSMGAKWPGHEANHLLTSCTKVKNEWGYTSAPQ